VKNILRAGHKDEWWVAGVELQMIAIYTILRQKAITFSWYFYKQIVTSFEVGDDSGTA
jgi:hypothetical protein